MLLISPDPDTPAGPYLKGDTPPPVTAALVDEDGQALDMSALDIVAGVVREPDGISIQLAVTLDAAADTVTWTWPPAGFQLGGLHFVELSYATGATVEAVEPLPVVVEAGAGWLTLAMTRRLWRDAPTDDVALWLLLESARVSCANYAPALAEGEYPPENYLQAQLVQCRAVWNLMQTGPQTVDAIGLDQYAVRVFPLDYNVRQLLRPHPGKPVMW